MPPLGSIGAVVDLSKVQALMDDLTAKGADLIPVFRGRIAPDVQSHLREQYESRGAHLGTKLWPPLSLATIRNRTIVKGSKNRRRSTSRPGRAKGGFARPMWDTGRSRLSLVNLVDPEGIRSYQPQEMVWGSRMAYLAPHHREGGFDVTWGKHKVHIPQREVIPKEWPAPILTAWSGWILEYITGEP